MALTVNGIVLLNTYIRLSTMYRYNTTTRILSVNRNFNRTTVYVVSYFVQNAFNVR